MPTLLLSNGLSLIVVVNGYHSSFFLGTFPPFTTVDHHDPLSSQYFFLKSSGQICLVNVLARVACAFEPVRLDRVFQLLSASFYILCWPTDLHWIAQLNSTTPAPVHSQPQDMSRQFYDNGQVVTSCPNTARHFLERPVCLSCLCASAVLVELAFR